MTYQHQEFPATRYGPGGATVIVNSEDETPKGFEDHPSKVKGSPDQSDSGTKTARAHANSTVSAATAAKTTEAKSQTMTPPEVAAESGEPGLTPTPKKKAGRPKKAAALDL